MFPRIRSRPPPANSYAVPYEPQWAYEIKHDAFRFICMRAERHRRAGFVAFYHVGSIVGSKVE
jgi:hypothetical protein